MSNFTNPFSINNNFYGYKMRQMQKVTLGVFYFNVHVKWTIFHFFDSLKVTSVQGGGLAR
jgi:hypothetical protein